MTAIVACETLLLVLLVVLVASLLRSHAEILRRLGPPDEEAGDADALATTIVGPATRAAAGPAADVVGTTLEGDAVKIAVAGDGPPTLLAFLTSGCMSCAGFWEAFGSPHRAELPAGVRLVAITKDGAHESPARLRELRPDGLPVVLSTAAWDAYGVPAAPYFVYVEGGRVAGEGAASAWEQLSSLLRDALEDVRLAQVGGGEERTARMDRTLAAAGIGPGHPSLYPAGKPGSEPEEGA